jgi:hypothetical protein
MKTLEEIKNNLIARTTPLSADEHLEFREFVRVYGLKEFFKLIDSVGVETFNDVIKPNLNLEIKRKIIGGKVKVLREYLEEKNFKISEEEEESLISKYGTLARDFIVEER